MTPLFGHDQTVGEWVARSLGKTVHPPFTAIGWIDGQGTLRAGAVFNFWNGSNIEVTVYGPRAMSRPVLRTVFSYVFDQLKANRLTATTERANKRMRKILPRLGFVFESVQPKYYGPNKRNDAIVFRMFRRDARKWLS